MMMDAAYVRSPPLIAAARGKSRNVRRLQLLAREPRLRARDRVLIAVLAAAGGTVAAAGVVDGGVAEPRRAPLAEAARFADASDALREAFESGDLELMRAYLGAYTPQETALPADVEKALARH
jgi:hypothetical protein